MRSYKYYNEANIRKKIKTLKERNSYEKQYILRKENNKQNNNGGLKMKSPESVNEPDFNEICEDITNYYYGGTDSEFLNDDELSEVLQKLDELDDDKRFKDDVEDMSPEYDKESNDIIEEIAVKVLNRVRKEREDLEQKNSRHR